MCRMILASGAFDSGDIVAAAVAMASGSTADHDSTLRVHPHGWGAVWRDPSSDTGLAVLRDVRPAVDTATTSGLAGLRTDFLAIHVRHATHPATRGPAFTHPLHRPQDGWYFMHNGHLPTVHRLLGLPAHVFDTAAYFDYLIPRGAARLDAAAALSRLREIPPGGSAANAIAVRRDRAYVICYSTDRALWPRYFTLHRLDEPGRCVVASEVIPSLAPAHRWVPVPAETILEFPLEPERASG